MRWGRRLLGILGAVVVLAAACTAPPTTGGGDEPTTPAGDDQIGINQLQYIGSHNSYHLAPELSLLLALGAGSVLFPGISEGLDPAQLNYTHQPLVDQLNAGIRTFELDVWADPEGGLFSSPLGAQLLGLGAPGGMDQPGLKVLHIQDLDYRSTCPTLQACLGTMRTWSDAHPDHLPIIINLELKSDPLPSPFDVTPVVPFDAAQLDGVDDELRTAVGDRLITPDDVRGDAVDLRTAVTTGGWPTVAESRGRFMFFMDNADLRDLYLDGHPSLQNRVMFTSSGFGQPDAAVLKVNEPGDGTAIADLVAQGYLVRTRADADVVNPSPTQRDAALASGAQLVHSDFPPGEPQLFTGYVVTFNTRVAARCNPVNTTGATCQPAAAVEPAA